MAEQRMLTGIPGLDRILEGGFIKQRSYLLIGAAGTGKTIFSLQWLLEGVREGEKCLYITLAESREDIRRNVVNFGWTLEGMDTLDLSPSSLPEKPADEEYRIFSVKEVEQVGTWEAICKVIKEQKPQRLVIDSLTQLRFLSTDEYQFRKQILDLVTFLNKYQVTSLLLYEPSEFERETSVGLAVDGIIRLHTDISISRVIGLRNLQILKFRGSNFMSGYHPLQITNKGINIFPHLVEKSANITPKRSMLSSGIKQLDELLKGGLDTVTTTIISGPTGVGKSTLGVQYLVNATQQGKRGILFTFEETIDSIIVRSRGVGIKIDEALKSGNLKIVCVNPMEIYPDQFLENVRIAVEVDKFNVVMLDSLRGYQLAMEEYGTLVAHIHNLVTYLIRNEVTTLLINEVEEITGNLRVTELDVSHLGDNVILLRYAEYKGKVIKIIGCLKKRLSDFEPELRQMHITKEGILVSEKLEQMQGVLTGVPSFINKQD